MEFSRITGIFADKFSFYMFLSFTIGISIFENPRFRNVVNFQQNYYFNLFSRIVRNTPEMFDNLRNKCQK